VRAYLFFLFIHIFLTALIFVSCILSYHRIEYTTVKYDIEVFTNYKSVIFLLYLCVIFFLNIFTLYFLTIAKHSKDATKSPPTVKEKSLVVFCNRNSIIFCTCKGVKYHGTLYLQNYINKESII